MSWCNAQPIFEESWSLLVPDSFEFEKIEEISWKDASKLPFAMLRSSMHERRLIDNIFGAWVVRLFLKLNLSPYYI